MEDEKIRLEIPASTYVKYYMKKMGYPLKQPCHGDGQCGECLIQVVRGTLEPSLYDIYRLTDNALQHGFRLGCKAVTTTPVTIEVKKSQIQQKKEGNPFQKLFRKKS